ncbi:Pls/PosA family non-ribosomal peptide synthetase [Amycolatopsis jiangsuensis]|uniref:Non-ribosomal peptide synthetase-like protein n=1 Tax=Amycolatopsis jiangsuensis TaxID=1181879 RepID=A0A840IM41_9PSEU|nr:Pls/PosA family non-ribosomal peptide synthetase [Amycolatopsis jiangsuensis]MBB4683441.1 non-ribosomal peptide synthetase-like protein [Amycolatopsis jiangsuensis]
MSFVHQGIAGAELTPDLDIRTPTLVPDVPDILRSPGTRRLHHVFEASADRVPESVAVDCEGRTLTYAALETRANRLAHLLLGRCGTGARIAILLRRSFDTYAALLAVGKAGGTFVPIDPASPPDRIAYLTEDAGVDLLLTTADLAADAVRAAGVGCAVLELDTAAAELAAAPAHRPEPDGADDPVAYVIYTSGSSGRPKGVEVGQSSITNFLDVVPRIYDVRETDRVYQGMTISFDFSIEEIWPTWSAGATLVAGPNDSRRLGAELAGFLEQARVTMLYCVPTLLATIPRDLPLLRGILVGGEACPAQLVERWSRPGRRILNTYGPTEATVTATWGELLPGRPVTIGRPLPTYSVVLLDEDREPVPDGEIGEICLGGPGVARGYAGRPDLTADRFIEHALAPPGGRLYRTGDLGRWTAGGEVEYLGRADAEVKIRGHRVDLGEIESVLMEDPDIAEAVAAMKPVTEDGDPELVAYVVSATGNEDDDLIGRLHSAARDRLPGYMVPGYLDFLPALPVMPSGKVDRSRLPAPSGRRLASAGGPVVVPANESEVRVRAAWAQVFGIEESSLSVEADFFADLGGHSLLAARVVSALRQHPAGANTAVRDLYAHPTVRGMAALSADSGTAPAEVAARPAPIRHRRRRIGAAGAIQLVAIYLLLLVITLPVSYVYTQNDGEVSVPVLVQLLAAILISYLGVRWLVPLLLARPLAAGIRPGRYRLWGPTYLRLWLLDLVLAVGPLPVVSGSPLMPAYLRVLGARVGGRTTIATSSITLPALVRIDRNASVGYGVVLRPWRVADGWVTVAPITIGAGAFVGANSVLEPGTTLAAGAALGEQSVLGEGGTIHAGQRRSGSPAAPAAELEPAAEAMLAARGRLHGWRADHYLAAAAGLLGLEIGAIAMIVPGVALVWWALLNYGVLAGLLATLAAGPVFVLTVCVVVALGKRLVLPRVPVGVHPVRSWLGVRKWISDKLLEFSLLFTNSLYATLYTTPWLRLLGAHIGRRAEVSTAAHLDPDLLTLGQESFVADMASVGCATFANGRMTFLPTSVGSRAFIGNAAFVPSGSRLGDGSLVGVSTVPPHDGVPEGTSWLGSPAMHLPRRQDSGSFPEEQTFRPPRRVVAHRLAIEFCRATLPAALLGMSFYLYLLVLSSLAQGNYLPIPAFVSPVVAIAASLAVIGFCAATKRNLIGSYRPRVEPLWSRFVRRAEFVTGLYEAAAVPAGLEMLVGTPFLPALLRWFGVSVGHRTWIGTTYLTEFDLVRIGDDACVGTESSLQTHLFEDRVMKMSHVTVEPGATVGTRAIVLYDSVVGEQVSLGSLSLLMKGEQLPARTSWHGIPAQGLAAAGAAS